MSQLCTIKRTLDSQTRNNPQDELREVIEGTDACSCYSISESGNLSVVARLQKQTSSTFFIKLIDFSKASTNNGEVKILIMVTLPC